MTQKDEVRYLYDLLSHKNRWYVDVTAPDIELFQDIAEKAKRKVDSLLQNISFTNLWRGFMAWERDANKILSPQEDYYFSFLNDYAWDLGLKCLKGNERQYYEEGINLKVYFLA